MKTTVMTGGRLNSSACATGLGLLALSLCSLIAWAQQGINWETVDGGGRASTGGVFTLKGTIGQPDVASASGGDLTLAGGFWVPGAVQVPGAPVLTVASVGGGMMTISWSPPGTGWVLQESPSLMPTNWTDSASGTTNPITINMSHNIRFYRLQKKP